MGKSTSTLDQFSSCVSAFVLLRVAVHHIGHIPFGTLHEDIDGPVGGVVVVMGGWVVLGGHVSVLHCRTRLLSHLLPLPACRCCCSRVLNRHYLRLTSI